MTDSFLAQLIRVMPEHFGGGEFADHTTLHPLGVVAILALGAVMLAVRRSRAVIPMIVMACFVSSAQRVVVFGLDFNLIRVMILFGWARVALRREYASFVLRPIDIVLVLWAAVGTIAHTALMGTSGALIFKLGTSFEALGMYFLFRCLIRNWTDVHQVVIGVAIIALPVSLAFLVEYRTGRNLFSFLGGVPAVTMIRQGRLRCQGAFAHPIMAGCFWASMMPLLAAGWWARGGVRVCSMFGFVASALIVLACASSTPMFGVLCGMLGGVMFCVRGHMRAVRWGAVFSLVLLHMVMKAPVWHLISRVSAVGGSTGWHRFHLIDQAINRFDEWWLVGVPSTAHWGWGLQDVTNQYVYEGVQGGAFTLALFVATMALAFAGVGRIMRVPSVSRDRQKLAMSWALGIALFVHSANFVAVSYFGQVIVVWYLLLAMIGSLAPKRVFASSSVPRRTERRRWRSSHSSVGAAV